MKKITDFPCTPFAQLPTPLYKLERLSREFGKNIYIKRDDMTGAALGGNKVRKLEFLLADARAKGADVVLTAGGPQSNHAMLTAACAAKLGMSAILVLKKRGVLSGGNLILDEIFGAEVRFVDTDSYDGVYAEMERIMTDLRAQGHTPYFIPVGGSVPLGCLGYVNCAKEIANQAEDLGVDFDIIVSATGSGGTYAGLTLGAKLFLPGTVSVGIGVCDDPFEAISLDCRPSGGGRPRGSGGHPYPLPHRPRLRHPQPRGRRRRQASRPHRGHPGGPRVYRQGPGRVLPAPGGGQRLPGR